MVGSPLMSKIRANTSRSPGATSSSQVTTTCWDAVARWAIEGKPEAPPPGLMMPSKKTSGPTKVLNLMSGVPVELSIPTVNCCPVTGSTAVA